MIQCGAIYNTVRFLQKLTPEIKSSCKCISWNKYFHYSKSQTQIQPVPDEWVASVTRPGALLLTWIDLNPSMDNDNINYKVWDKFTYLYPNLNSVDTEVWEWVSNSILRFDNHVIIYLCWRVFLVMCSIFQEVDTYFFTQHNVTIASVPGKQPWRIWLYGSYKDLMIQPRQTKHRETFVYHNSVRAEFACRNINMYLQFLWFLHTDMTQIAEVLLRVRLGYVSKTHTSSLIWELINFQYWIKFVSFNVWVKYFVWNFKVSLGNSTENILSIHRKKCNLLIRENIRVSNFIWP